MKPLDALLGALDRAGRQVARRFTGGDVGAERFEARTADGWQLALWRVRRTERPPHGPLLCVHGLGACHQMFLLPGRSLAGHLADEGFDCWVADLRGAGASAPERGEAAWDWDLHDHLEQDVPALLECVKANSGAARLAWLGHSLGGVLLYLHGIRTGAPAVSAGVTIASALSYAGVGSNLEGLRRLIGLTGLVARVPQGLLRLYAPLAGVPGLAFDRFAFHPDNFERAVAQRFHARVHEDISPRLLQHLAATFGPDGFCDRGGTSYTRAAARFDRPLLALVGSDDAQCTPRAARATVAALGSADRTLEVLGPPAQAARYGHVDPLLGRHAPREVWPRLAAWLRAHATIT